MGDWQPDNTITMTRDEGGFYELPPSGRLPKELKERQQRR
jgi:hypothetical protein